MEEEGKRCGLGEGSCSSNRECLEGLICRKCNRDGDGKKKCCGTAWEHPGIYNSYKLILREYIGLGQIYSNLLT